MKAMTLIPKKVKKMYDIVKWQNSDISVNSPAYVSIYFDECFRIIETKMEIKIQNSKCIVCLYKDIKNMHITIYK